MNNWPTNFGRVFFENLLRETSIVSEYKQCRSATTSTINTNCSSFPVAEPCNTSKSRNFRRLHRPFNGQHAHERQTLWSRSIAVLAHIDYRLGYRRATKIMSTFLHTIKIRCNETFQYSARLRKILVAGGVDTYQLSFLRLESVSYDQDRTNPHWLQHKFHVSSNYTPNLNGLSWNFSAMRRTVSSAATAAVGSSDIIAS